MGQRLELHKKLRMMADNVYYQPPSDDRMKYPCFLYRLSTVNSDYANNKGYINHKAYTITYICYLPEDDIIEKMFSKFEYCSFDREYSSDDLHHYVFRVFY